MRSKTCTILISLLLMTGCPDQVDCGQTSSFVADGYTWINSCWPVYMTEADPGALQQMVDDGLLMPAVDSCYEAAFTDAHICILSFDGESLLARPSDELGDIAESESCPDADGWTINVSPVDGRCWAMIDGFGVRVWDQ